jgi:hypothetical protein
MKRMINKTLIALRACLVVLILLASATIAVAAPGDPYWVSPSGASTWTNCQSADALDGSAACSLATANSNAVPGGTIYLRGGTYSQYIAPRNSGTAAQRIIFQNYGSETVTIQNAAYGILLDGKSYITVQGIDFTGCISSLYIQNSAHHNIIAYCDFISSPVNWDSSIIYGNSQYNWIHHCQFSKGGECSAAGSDRGTVIDIGYEESSTDLTSYNLIEDSVFFHGGHHVMGIFGSYNIIRNNYFHNEEWSRGRGNRNLYFNGMDPGTGHNILEGNRFGYAARPCDDYTVGNLAVSTPNNILRYNELYHHNAYGLAFYSYGTSEGANNKVYSNTIFNSGYNIYPTYKGGGEDTAIWFMSSSSVATGNAIKNNLYYSNYQVYSGNTAVQTFSNNWNGDVQGDPKFVSASLTPPTDKTDSTLPNLDLQSNSPAINAGGALTTVATADTGSGTSLIVTEAGYFQDGTWAPLGTVQADWIAVGTVENVAQIASISGNTIALANSIARNDNDPVWLYKKSDGVRVLYGSAPDAGAYEYVGSAPPPPPPPPPTVPGDLNNDGKVDISDLVIVATNFGRTSGFDVRANVVSSSPEVIDISDLSFVARRFTG